MIGKAVHTKDAQIAYVAPTHQQAKDIAWNILKRVAYPIVVKVNEASLQMEVRNIHGTTSKIYLRSWEAVEQHFRGMYFDMIVLDEVAMYSSFWNGWYEVLTPTLADKQGEALFISTPKGFNHFYDLYNFQDEDPDYKSFRFTSYDNPHIKKEEIDSQKDKLPGDKFAQEYMAEFKKMEGLVYPEFKREIHIFNMANTKIEARDVLCGVDWGYNSPAAVLKIVTDEKKCYWVTDEWYKTGQTTDQIIQLTHMYRPNFVYPDPAEPDRLKEMRNSGLNVREANKDVTAGIDKVRELFKQQRIKIASHCRNLIFELETYRYPDLKDKKYDHNPAEKPVKENDHALDALRYVIYTHNPSLEFGYDFKPINKAFK
jgi:PBSX family phage terminase large subunit